MHEEIGAPPEFPSTNKLLFAKIIVIITKRVRNFSIRLKSTTSERKFSIDNIILPWQSEVLNLIVLNQFLMIEHYSSIKIFQNA